MNEVAEDTLWIGDTAIREVWLKLNLREQEKYFDYGKAFHEKMLNAPSYGTRIKKSEYTATYTEERFDEDPESEGVAEIGSAAFGNSLYTGDLRIGDGITSLSHTFVSEETGDEEEGMSGLSLRTVRNLHCMCP